MKIMQTLIITLFSLLLHSNAYGITLSYTGLECLNTTNANDLTTNEIPIQSKFEVIEDVGEGIFRLSLSGGIPRIANNDFGVCIDSFTAIGYAGIPQIDGIPQLLKSIDATAYYSGQDLIIVISSFFTDLRARRNPFSSFDTSFIFAITNTLILEFNPQSTSFQLKKLIHNRGFTHTSGSTNSIIPFQETVLPSFNETALDKPRILTPLTNIEYLLEK